MEEGKSEMNKEKIGRLTRVLVLSGVVTLSSSVHLSYPRCQDRLDPLPRKNDGINIQ